MIVDRIGARVLKGTRFAGSAMGLVFRTLHTAWEERGDRGGLVVESTVLQLWFTGIQAFRLVAVAALTLGVIVILQAEVLLKALPTPDLVERTIVVILVRELPAILVAILLIARSGTAIATELANMRLNREMEGIAAHGIPPEHYIYFPRLLGFPLAAFCLTVYFILIGVGGGILLIPVLHPEPLSFSLGSLLASVEAIDLLLPAVKSVLFGFVTALLCCAHGSAVERSFQEVPRAATRAVTGSFMLCMILNALLSLAGLP